MPDASISINKVLDNEGGHFIPQDQGRGASRWGITLATAQSAHPSWKATDIWGLTRDEAYQFYLKYIWTESHCALLVDQEVCDKVFDLYVNMGPKAIKLLQEVCGEVDDGILGPETAAAANREVPDVLLEKYRAAAESRYREIAADNPSQAGNLPGWLARLAKA